MSNISLPLIKKNISASVCLPGSKSIANRILILAALSIGTNTIHNIPDVSEDVQLMLSALKQLGVGVVRLQSSAFGASYEITGCGGYFPVATAQVFCGNSGTSIRFLAAALAFAAKDGASYQLAGIERMKERPIGDLVSGLRQLGANIIYLEQDGFPPIQIERFTDNQHQTIKISGRVSSQFLTGVLMALPLLGREVEVQVIDGLISEPYVEITLALIKLFGVEITHDGSGCYKVHSGGLKAITYTVEPDASSASYFLAMGAIQGDITIEHLSKASLQGDKNFAHVLHQMGAKVSYLPDAIVVKTGKLTGITVNMNDMPDVAMTIAMVALFATGTTVITGIESWRVKETNRLEAMYNELTRLGASVEITEASISITPPRQLNENVSIRTYNDHRMAMCFSLAAFRVAVSIEDVECVNKTFAGYFTLFKQLCYENI